MCNFVWPQIAHDNISFFLYNFVCVFRVSVFVSSHGGHNLFTA